MIRKGKVRKQNTKKKKERKDEKQKKQQKQQKREKRKNKDKKKERNTDGVKRKCRNESLVPDLFTAKHRGTGDSNVV